MQSLTRPRVLYADDDEDACLMLSTLLGLSNIETKSANTIDEALKWRKPNSSICIYSIPDFPKEAAWICANNYATLILKRRLFFTQVMRVNPIKQKGWRLEQMRIWSNRILILWQQLYFDFLNKPLKVFTKPCENYATRNQNKGKDEEPGKN